MPRMMSIADAEHLVSQALVANRVAPKAAETVARALVAAEVDGQAGHGFSRVASYAAQTRSGKVDGFAVPEAVQQRAALVSVDAQHGFAYPAIDLAIENLLTMAPVTGIAGAAITRSHHAGQLGAHVERLAENGLVALMVANTPKAMAPWGGNAALFGTNPIAFAAPRDSQSPLVIDLSLSEVARGKVMAAKKRGEKIPTGWALDATGNPTTDPDAALQGTMVPMGGAKGAALALIVEVLAATLTGANHSHEATSFFDGEGNPPGVGQLIIALDAGHGFAARLDGLLADLESQDGARIPGTRRLAARDKARENGIEIAGHLWAEISTLATGVA